MLETVLTFLTEQEPLISAIVGVITIAAAIWGVIQLVLLSRRNAAKQPALEASVELTSGRQVPGTVRTLLNLGLTQGSELEQLIAVRTVNIVTFCGLVISLWGAIAGIFAKGMIVLTIINGAVFIAFLMVLGLHVGGRHFAAKWLFYLIVIFYWVIIMAVVGPFAGLEYFVALIVVLPVLLFTRQERQAVFIAVSLGIFAVIAALVLQRYVTYSVGMESGFYQFSYYFNAVLFAAGLFVVIKFYNSFAATSFHNLEAQKLRTDELVNSLLPAYVAERVKNQELTVADWHGEATVLVAHVVGFESLAKRVSAVHLVELLGKVFTQFDELTKKYGIDKVNSLGTNYIVASGIGEDGATKHAAIAMFAVDSLAIVRSFSQAINHPLSFRAGISTGQVVSGVIGDVRPCFDIWGETVELANSLRDTAVENSIVVNAPAYWRLKDQFEFAPIDEEENAYMLLRLRQSSTDHD